MIWLTAWLGLLGLVACGVLMMSSGRGIAAGVAGLAAMVLSAVLTQAAHAALDQPPKDQCERCGYSLKGLRAVGGRRRCPECGAVDVRGRSHTAASGVHQPSK